MASLSSHGGVLCFSLEVIVLLRVRSGVVRRRVRPVIGIACQETIVVMTSPSDVTPVEGIGAIDGFGSGGKVVDRDGDIVKQRIALVRVSVHAVNEQFSDSLSWRDGDDSNSLVPGIFTLFLQRGRR